MNAIFLTRFIFFLESTHTHTKGGEKINSFLIHNFFFFSIFCPVDLINYSVFNFDSVFFSPPHKTTRYHVTIFCQFIFFKSCGVLLYNPPSFLCVSVLFLSATFVHKFTKRCKIELFFLFVCFYFLRGSFLL